MRTHMKLPERKSRTGSFTCALVLALSTTLFVSCSSFAPRPTAPIAAITSAAERGESSDQIIAAIRAAKTTYALRGSDFARLAERGVPAPVLDELQQRFFGDIEYLTRFWYTRGLMGGNNTFYPQPVDLDTLDNGGNGMAVASNLGNITHFGRPPGVPEWVPATPAPPFSARISVDDVVQMTKREDSAQKIVAALREGHVKPLYAASGNVIAGERKAAITGSLFARLAEQGVTLAVLDALQETYLADHVEQSRLQYTGRGGTTPSNGKP